MKSIFLILALALSLSANAKVVLQPMFSDNMVLQQQTSAPIWGEARAGKTVTVTTSWDGRSYRTKAAADGRWQVAVETPKAGGPYDITISDGQRLTLRNVLIGEVWLCGGQSNMVMPVKGWDIPMNADIVAGASQFTNIRLLQVDHATSATREKTLRVKNNTWMKCSPETVRDFSAAGFFFGKEISEKEHVPVGLVMSCWEGTPIESWISGNDSADGHWRQHRDEAYWTWVKGVMRKEGCLDGKGRVVFAQKDFDDSRWTDVKVPSVLNKDFDGFAWFRKTIDIPKAWAGKPLDLYLEQVDDNDVTFFNGVQIGENRYFSIRRRYTIPASLVKAGKAVITVLNIDNGDRGGLHGIAHSMKLCAYNSDESVSLAGTWKVNYATKLEDAAPLPEVINDIPRQPSTLFNAMISPLIPFAIRGVIWYQGEDNAARAYQYRDLQPMLIRDWRTKWGYEFPFYFVQLANWRQRHAQPVESQWAELREAQLLTAKHVAGTGMAGNIDIGMANNIHPINKKEVGHRLALIAEALTYGDKTIEYSGPLYEDYKIEGGKIRVSFSHAEGMKAKDGQPLTGFAIAGPDHVFHWAEARIEGNTVVVSSKDVPCPLAVRYAWDDNPACNLTNASGLPASPFRTDTGSCRVDNK